MHLHLELSLTTFVNKVHSGIDRMGDSVLDSAHSRIISQYKATFSPPRYYVNLNITVSVLFMAAV